MKFSKILLTIAAIVFTISTFAQTPVELHITQKLNGINAFAYNQASKNSLSNDFYLTRLEYYISKISITHDGGMVTDVPNHYILVDASQNTIDPLGSFNITNVESISFYIGVDTPVNHADPSTQPSGHPLAPRFPSMHWGWSSGYRFVALEGKSGPNFNQDLQLHCLFDEYYYKQTVTVSGVSKGGKIIIPLYGDYAQALRDIDISSGVFNHGDKVSGEDIKVLENFRDYVFKEGSPVSVNNIVSAKQSFEVYPNPTNGQFYVSSNMNTPAVITVSDIQGRIVAQYNKAANQKEVQVQLNTAGMYFIKAAFDNGDTQVQKVIVQ